MIKKLTILELTFLFFSPAVGYSTGYSGRLAEWSIAGDLKSLGAFKALAGSNPASTARKPSTVETQSAVIYKPASPFMAMRRVASLKLWYCTHDRSLLPAIDANRLEHLRPLRFFGLMALGFIREGEDVPNPWEWPQEVLKRYIERERPNW